MWIRVENVFWQFDSVNAGHRRKTAELKITKSRKKWVFWPQRNCACEVRGPHAVKFKNQRRQTVKSRGRIEAANANGLSFWCVCVCWISTELRVFFACILLYHFTNLCYYVYRYRVSVYATELVVAVTPLIRITKTTYTQTQAERHRAYRAHAATYVFIVSSQEHSSSSAHSAHTHTTRHVTVIIANSHRASTSSSGHLNTTTTYERHHVRAVCTQIECQTSNQNDNHFHMESNAPTANDGSKTQTRMRFNVANRDCVGKHHWFNRNPRDYFMIATHAGFLTHIRSIHYLRRPDERTRERKTENKLTQFSKINAIVCWEMFYLTADARELRWYV